MDDLAREIKETIEAYKARGTPVEINGQTFYQIRPESAYEVTLGEKKTRAWESAFFIPKCSIQPPVDLEKKHGLVGIAGYFVLPQGVTSEDLDTYLSILDDAEMHGEMTRAAYSKRLQDIHALLLQLNPELGQLVYKKKDAFTLSHVICGVIAGINIDDIQSFIAGNSAAVAREDLEYRILRQKWEGEIGWVPSMKTLKEIDRQLTEKRAQKPKRPKSRGANPKQP